MFALAQEAVSAKACHVSASFEYQHVCASRHHTPLPPRADGRRAFPAAMEEEEVGFNVYSYFAPVAVTVYQSVLN